MLSRPSATVFIDCDNHSLFQEIRPSLVDSEFLALGSQFVGGSSVIPCSTRNLVRSRSLCLLIQRIQSLRKSARIQETMMMIRAVMTFAIAQVVLAREHASRRSMDAVNAVDREHADTKVVQHIINKFR